MTILIQHPDNPECTRYDLPITSDLAVLGYGPFGTCASCRHHYEQDMTKGGDNK